MTLPRRTVVIGLCALSGLAVAGGFAVMAGQTAPVTTDISVTEAHSRAISGDLLLVDIRRPNEWSLTGLGEGAVPLDMRRVDFLDVLTDLAGADPTRPIALICAAGVRSARLARKLERAGFTNVINIPEGMTGSSAGPGWLRRGLPRIDWKGQK